MLAQSSVFYFWFTAQWAPKKKTAFLAPVTQLVRVLVL